MGTSSADLMSSIVNPPIITPLTNYHKISDHDELDQNTQSNNNENVVTNNIKESRLKTTNEVFDLIKSEISGKSKQKYDNINELVNEISFKSEELGAKISSENIESEEVKTLPIKKTVLEEHGFKVGYQIGSGTYAKVKVAYSNEYKKPVAIKIISKMRAPSEYLNRFLPREIEVIKTLRHENLIEFYQSIETTHRVYIIMQLAENGSLLDLIRNQKQLNDTQARKYFQQLINALEYCHSKGVVHRDIKCENLLLDQNLNLKLIDFGFARGEMFPVDNAPVLSETYCGSFAYASPEILKGIPYDPRMSDIWASGVVLYAMIYGHLPYDGSNCNYLLKQVQLRIVFPKHPANVSMECKNLIIKLLAPLKIRYQIWQIKRDKWYSDK